ncbi:MAG: tyrosine-type recombinase/integrase [Halobacteriales archaeon]
MSSSVDSDREPDNIEDPVEYFLRDLAYHGRSDRTRSAYRRVLDRFETFLVTEETEAVVEAGHRECLAWIHELRASAGDSTVATYASYLNRFYDYMIQVGVVEENPMALVMAEMEEGIDTDPTRREVSVPEMRRFVGEIHHPLDRAVVVTLLKTGMRVGELCNLDMRDLALENSMVRRKYDATPRGQLDAHDRTLYVDAGILRGDVVNGEERTASNKRKRSTLVPIDDELADALVGWLAIRPDARSEADPLFLSTRDAWGMRMTPDMVRSVVESHAREQGWHRTGGGAEENVTPHYFRHFFTTHLRDRTGDRGVVKYLRGDVAEDIIDTYTHNWGDRVRAVYEAHVYSLL